MTRSNRSPYYPRQLSELPDPNENEDTIWKYLDRLERHPELIDQILGAVDHRSIPPIHRPRRWDTPNPYYILMNIYQIPLKEGSHPYG